MGMNEYLFDVTGGFSIDDKIIPELAFDKSVMGFELPDGRTVRLMVALEVEGINGSQTVVSEKAMAELGFEALDYDKTHFTEVEE